MTVAFEAHDEPDLPSVWTWFEYQIALISESQRRVLRCIGLTPFVSRETLLTHEEQFIGFTRSEVEEFFDAQRDQLELLTMFEILAVTEAVLRTEVKTRATARKKDPLSRRFRKLPRDKGDRLRLDEDILIVMKDEGVSARAIAAFRGALNLRHWLAHGRHWNPKLGRSYLPADVFDISRDLIDSTPPS